MLMSKKLALDIFSWFSSAHVLLEKEMEFFLRKLDSDKRFS